MATRREIRSDIILRLTAGRPSDDFEIDDRQINFWVDTVRAMILDEKLRSDASYSLEPFITSFDGISILKESINGAEEGINDTRYYSELPGQVLKLKDDTGIYLVETNGGETVFRIKPSDKKRIKNLRWAKPNHSKIAYYRVNDRIIYQGGTSNFLKNGKVNMLLVLSDTTANIGDDDEYPIPADILPLLLQSVEEVGRRELGIQMDMANDGK